MNESMPSPSLSVKFIFDHNSSYACLLVLVASACQVLHAKEVPQSQTMLTDVLTAVARGKHRKENYNGNDPERINLMSINTMRKKLDQRGLSVDGSREMLMDAVEESVDVKNVVMKGAGITEINGLYNMSELCNMMAAQYTFNKLITGERLQLWCYFE